MADNRILESTWDDSPVDITQEANDIWSIARKLRGSYMPDKYGDVVIPMTIIRRLECALEPTKSKVVEAFKKNPSTPSQILERLSGVQFYCTSDYTLKELCNDPDLLAENFKQYIKGFSTNVQDICKELEVEKHIDKMDKDGCLYSVVQAFSEKDLSPQTFDSIKMGYIFENLIGRFYQNVDAGQFYTGRDIIKLLVEVLMAEGCDDIFDHAKVITIEDQAAGTGGILSTAHNYIRHFNPTADVRLFGQENQPSTYAIGLAEMLIKGQNAENYRHADTLKEDCFKDTKMRFVIENPPFGTPWGGKDAKEGQEAAVKEEFANGVNGRWGHGLPGTGDAQLLFLQSAVDKMDDDVGRAAIIQNGSSLFTGGTASGESQIRRWLLESDLVEAIIALPTDLFYNTGIQTFVWILSKNKRPERRGKIQLINAEKICHKLRKPLGKKKFDISPEDRKVIAHLYVDFKENENCKIFPNEEFLYHEYAVMQPLQRSYAITDERIDNLLLSDALSVLYDEAKLNELSDKLTKDLTEKEKKKLKEYEENKPLYDQVVERLKGNVSDQKYLSPKAFAPVLADVLGGLVTDKKLLSRIADGLSLMDKSAEIQRDKHGEIIYDKDTKDVEIVKFEESIDDYMAREVLPHIPDAKWFWEEDLTKKNPVIKTGAEIPFTRYFYKYKQSKPSEELRKQFIELEVSVSERIKRIFGEDM